MIQADYDLSSQKQIFDLSEVILSNVNEVETRKCLRMCKSLYILKHFQDD